MNIQLRILLTAITMTIALWLLFDAREDNFQPRIRTKLKLWTSGFVLGVSVSWLISGGAFTEAIRMKLLTGFIGGFVWAFRLANLLEHTSKLAKQRVSQENKNN